MSQQVNIFLDSLNSSHTKEQYQIQWDRYEKSKPTYSQDTKVITNNIVSYLMEMKKEGLSYSYRNTAFYAIKHHYTMVEDVVLNWTRISKFLGERTFDNEIRGYTREEIQRMLKVADIKYRAVILLLASTSMRREALTQITRDDIEYIKKHKLYKIKIYRKTPDEHICYTTPEAAEALDLYLEMNKVEGHNSLFDFKTPKNLTMTLRQIQIRSGVGKEHIQKGEKAGQARNNIPAVHGLRKFCITQMAKSGIGEERQKILSGHSIGVRKKYVELSDEDLLQDYLKAVNNLTINEENRLKTQVEVLEEKDRQIETLQEQVQDLIIGAESTVKTLNEMNEEANRHADLAERQNELVALAETKRSNREIEKSESLIKKLEELPQEDWVKDFIEREREFLKIAQRRISDLDEIYKSRKIRKIEIKKANEE